MHPTTHHPLEPLQPAAACSGTLKQAAVVLSAAIAVLAWAAPAEATTTTRTETAAAVSMNRVAPKYPATAYCEGASGTTVVIVDIDTLGQVSHATIESSSRNRDLDRAALLATRQWQFKPARDASGAAMPTRMRIPVDFQLPPGDGLAGKCLLLTLTDVEHVQGTTFKPDDAIVVSLWWPAKGQFEARLDWTLLADPSQADAEAGNIDTAEGHFTEQVSFREPRTLVMTVPPPQGKWRAGLYILKMSIDGQLVGATKFVIQPASAR